MRGHLAYQLEMGGSRLSWQIGPADLRCFWQTIKCDSRVNNVVRDEVSERGLMNMSEASLRRIRATLRELEHRVRRHRVTVVLMGSNRQGLLQRRRLRDALSREGVIALIPEDDFPKDVPPSIAERKALSMEEIDLIFLNLQSWGTATEFGQFHEHEQIARKLRVLVDCHHHPLCSDPRSYLSDLCLTHLAAYGHVYPIASNRGSPCPSAKKTIVRLAVRYGQWRALR